MATRTSRTERLLKASAAARALGISLDTLRRWDKDGRIRCVRDDANQYLRTLPRFETAAPRYAFLNRLLAVGMGEIGPAGPVHAIEEIL